MNDHTPPPAGHNNPPADAVDPIDEALAAHFDTIQEAENWLDGDPLETTAQMASVDALIKEMRTVGADIERAKKAATDPLHKAWKAEGDRWKPTIEDIDRIKTKLVQLVAPIKKKLADAEAAAKRAAWQAAEQARKDAEAAEAAAAAEGTNIDADREAAALKEAALQADKDARAASKSKVKGMRTVHKHKVMNGQDVINWIIANDKPAVQRFIADYVASSPRKTEIEGVHTYTEREAY